MKSRTKLIVVGAAVGASLILAGSFAMNAAPPDQRKLPEPRTRGGPSLAEVLAERRSARSFSDEPLSVAELSQLCWAGQGITAPEHGYRSAPSAGALYPIHLYVATREGVHRYIPGDHVLRLKGSDDIRGQLERNALHQEWVGDAPAVFIIAADISRTASKYGDRARRYCLLEAGHVCQNILLQATALDLAGVPVGAFEDDKIARTLKLPERQEPFYLVPIGHAE